MFERAWCLVSRPTGDISGSVRRVCVGRVRVSSVPTASMFVGSCALL